MQIGGPNPAVGLRSPTNSNDNSGLSRMPDTGFGSATFLRARRIAPACRQIEGRGPRAAWARLRAGSALLAWYRRRLPTIKVRLTPSRAGRMIGEHFAIRERGRWRYRDAQGVLPLPAEFSHYMRGRHRQAVRTNTAHARKAGLTVLSMAIDNWTPGTDDSRAAHLTPGPVERWMVLNPDGEIVADSILSIDEHVALLHGLVTIAANTNARWLLHTAIVERLCGSCPVLLTNSDDAYFMGTGNQHFQRLLGYEISRLRVSRASRSRGVEPPAQPAGLSWPPDAQFSCGLAAHFPPAEMAPATLPSAA
jgi:hypothetical protein